MELLFNNFGQAGVVTVSGSVDALTAVELNEFITSQISNGNTRLVIDLGQVEFMSSAGLRAILASFKESRQNGGDLRLAAPQPGIEKVLKLSGFLNIIKTFSSPEEALKSYAE
jgi:anti-sigma B factor antagonist